MSQPVIKLPIEIDVEDIITEDDEPKDDWFSEKQQRLLTEPLYSSWRPIDPETHEPRKFIAAANVGLFPTRYQPPLVPDMFLSLDVEIHPDWYDKNHRTYFFWEFGKAPEAVVEVVSNRKGNEAGSKLRDYARIKVDYYVIYDPTRQLSDEPLQVYERREGQYVGRPDATLPGVNLSLVLWDGVYEGVQDTWLRWADADGTIIPTGAEGQAREAERAARESERAEREANRAERLAAKLRELGIDPDAV
ncbi:MAG TPA: Uma2 family endonuclease [Blastocatellia bacterium]|nr:Uma2 family endonuclease [Blastocatellia bacterium]